MSSPEAYQAFKAALGAAPYLNLTPDSAIFAQTESPVVVWNDVTTPTLGTYIASHFVLDDFLNWAAALPSDATPEGAKAAKSLARAINNPQLITNFAMSDPTVRANMEAALTALENASASSPCPITPAIGAGILALAQTTTTDWQEWGFRAPPTQADLDFVRTMP